MDCGRCYSVHAIWATAARVWGSQAWGWPKCHGQHDTFSSPRFEQPRFRANIVSFGSGTIPWAPSIIKTFVLMVPMPFSPCHGHGKAQYSNPVDTRSTHAVLIPYCNPSVRTLLGNRMKVFFLPGQSISNSMLDLFFRFVSLPRNKFMTASL